MTEEPKRPKTKSLVKCKQCGRETDVEEAMRMMGVPSAYKNVMLGISQCPRCGSGNIDILQRELVSTLRLDRENLIRMVFGAIMVFSGLVSIPGYLKGEEGGLGILGILGALLLGASFLYFGIRYLKRTRLRVPDLVRAHPWPIPAQESTCKAYRNGHCLSQQTGESTGPCTWQPTDWQHCAVVDENRRFYGQW